MESLNEIWATVLAKIKEEEEEMSIETYNLWFSELVLEKLTNTCAYITPPDTLRAEIVASRYMPTLYLYLEKVLGFRVDIQLNPVPGTSNKVPKEEKVEIDMDRFNEAIESRADHDYLFTEEEEKPEPILQSGFVKYNPDYTFENFIVGSTNNLACAACKAIAQNANHSYNPLSIYGPPGLGKTHLLYAIINEILKTREGCKVLYVRGEEFANQLINSLAQRVPMQYFRDKYRNVDVLLVDDIQFIAGKVSTQEEFFHTFETLFEKKKQIILTSDRPPRDIASLEERLRTRFEMGLGVDIQPPDLELRMAILRKKAEDAGIVIPPHVLEYVAENLQNNIRQLEGAVKRLSAQYFINGSQLSIEIAQKCIHDLIVTAVPVNVTIDKIFENVSKTFNVSISDIKGKKRTKEIAEARHITIYLLRQITNLSLNDIGKLFGDMHHTSVLSAYNNVLDELPLNPSLDFSVNTIIKNIK